MVAGKRAGSEFHVANEPAGDSERPTAIVWPAEL